MLIITGPNMGGKSTYMRQTALIVILAHIGSFVPAEAATIGTVDRIFTRIGAADDLTGGRSTFMVEMTETARILNNATRASLVLMDEVGRGTSTFDGLSLAWAAARHIGRELDAFTLFATHYFELTSLPDDLPNCANVHLDATEHGRELVFLHSVKPGPANQSYGLNVAELAGVPRRVIDDARGYLKLLEREQQALAKPNPQQELGFEAVPPNPTGYGRGSRHSMQTVCRPARHSTCSTNSSGSPGTDAGCQTFEPLAVRPGRRPFDGFGNRQPAVAAMLLRVEFDLDRGRDLQVPEMLHVLANARCELRTPLGQDRKRSLNAGVA